MDQNKQDDEPTKSIMIAPDCISAYVIRQTANGAKYLLIRRCGKYLSGTWQMVSGGIEPGETASAAALREIQEETGLSPYALYSADAVETFYMKNREQIVLVPVFAAFVENETVRLSPTEHDAYEWLSFEAARDRLVWSEQKRVLTHIHNSFILKKPNPLLLIDRSSPIARPMFTRTGVYGIVMRNKKILLVKQNKGPHAGKWDLPGGGIEPGETIEKALRREMLEETAMEFEEMRSFANLTVLSEGIDGKDNPYDFHQIGLIYQIDGTAPSNSHIPEMETAWIDLEQLKPENIAPFVRQILALKKNLQNK